MTTLDSQNNKRPGNLYDYENMVSYSATSTLLSSVLTPFTPEYPRIPRRINPINSSRDYDKFAPKNHKTEEPSINPEKSNGDPPSAEILKHVNYAGITQECMGRKGTTTTFIPKVYTKEGLAIVIDKQSNTTGTQGSMYYVSTPWSNKSVDLEWYQYRVKDQRNRNPEVKVPANIVPKTKPSFCHTTSLIPLNPPTNKRWSPPRFKGQISDCRAIYPSHHPPSKSTPRPMIRAEEDNNYKPGYLRRVAMHNKHVSFVDEVWCAEYDPNARIYNK